MPSVDGSIVIGVDMSLTKAEQQLRKFEQKVEDTEDKINDITAKRDQASQDGVFQAAVLDKEKAKLEEIKASLRDIKATPADKVVLSEQQERVRGLQSEWNKIQSEVQKYDNQLLNAKMELDQNKQKAGELAEAIERSRTPTERFKRGMEEAGDSVEKVGNRLKRLASRVLVFSVFTMALRAARKWMMSVIKTNDDATKAMAKLKGALLTLVQPLVNVIIPAFIALVQVLTNVVAVIARVMSTLFGTTIEDSAKAAENLKAEQDALDGVGKAAKKAGKQLASFDEINQIQDTSSIGGGSSTAAAEIVPDFSFVDELDERLKDIADTVLFIGAGFALWKIGGALGGALGGIASQLGLVLIAIGGIVLAWNGLKDAWENGVDWLNMAEMIGGVAIAAAALYKAFGPVAAGIALVVGGIAMLTAGFKDVMENGWSLQNVLLIIAGLFSTGLGLSFLTHSAIPALIGAFLGIGLAIAVFTGHGEELIDGFKQTFEGLVGFVENIAKGDWPAAMASLASAVEGIGIIFNAIIDGIKDLFIGFLDWLDEHTGGKFHDIIESIKFTVEWLFESVREVLNGIIDFIAGIFTQDWQRVWDGICEIVDGIAGVVLTPFVGVINLIIDGLNSLIRGLNKISFDVPDWVPVLGGKTWGVNIPEIGKIKVPQLAEGAVIPANREFLAVLGDQKNGTNIEAPMSTIEQGVENVLRRMGITGGGGGTQTVILQLDRREFARAVYSVNNEETQRVGLRLTGGKV